MLGQPADKPLLDTAVVVPRVARLTSDVVARASPCGDRAPVAPGSGAGGDGHHGLVKLIDAVRYQHMTAPVRRDIAKRVGGLLWTTGDGTSEDDDGGAAGGA